jgi:hypothetical protein
MNVRTTILAVLALSALTAVMAAPPDCGHAVALSRIGTDVSATLTVDGTPLYFVMDTARAASWDLLTNRLSVEFLRCTDATCTTQVGGERLTVQAIRSLGGLTNAGDAASGSLGVIFGSHSDVSITVAAQVAATGSSSSGVLSLSGSLVGDGKFGSSYGAGAHTLSFSLALAMDCVLTQCDLVTEREAFWTNPVNDPLGNAFSTPAAMTFHHFWSVDNGGANTCNEEFGNKWNFAPTLPGKLFFDDLAGTLRMVGQLENRNHPDFKMDVDLTFTDRFEIANGEVGSLAARPAKCTAMGKTGCLKRELRCGSYWDDESADTDTCTLTDGNNPGPIDGATGVYYENMSGSMTGAGLLAGLRLKPQRLGPPLQIALGGANKNFFLGLAIWFTFEVEAEVTDTSADPLLQQCPFPAVGEAVRNQQQDFNAQVLPDPCPGRGDECRPCKGGATSLTVKYRGDANPANVEVQIHHNNGDPVQTVNFTPSLNMRYFEISALLHSSEDTLGHKLVFSVDGGEEFTVYVDCTRFLYIGQPIGPELVIADGTSLEGGDLCPDEPQCVEFTAPADVSSYTVSSGESHCACLSFEDETP